MRLLPPVHSQSPELPFRLCLTAAIGLQRARSCCEGLRDSLGGKRNHPSPHPHRSLPVPTSRDSLVLLDPIAGFASSSRFRVLVLEYANTARLQQCSEPSPSSPVRSSKACRFPTSIICHFDLYTAALVRYLFNLPLLFQGQSTFVPSSLLSYGFASFQAGYTQKPTSQLHVDVLAQHFGISITYRQYRVSVILP